MKHRLHVHGAACNELFFKGRKLQSAMLPSRRLSPEMKQSTNVVTVDTALKDRGIGHACSHVPLTAFLKGMQIWLLLRWYMPLNLEIKKRKIMQKIYIS